MVALIASEAETSSWQQALLDEIRIVDRFKNVIHLSYYKGSISCEEIRLDDRPVNLDCSLLSPVRDPDLQNIALYVDWSSESVFHELTIPFFSTSSGQEADFSLVIRFEMRDVSEIYFFSGDRYDPDYFECLTSSCEYAESEIASPP